MAGRYLLVEFDDPAAADTLRARIDAASRAGKGFRVVGLFAIPGPNFCDCGTHTETKTQRSTIKRGKKFGWWVCTTCKLPLGAMRLTNLLGVDEIIRPRAYRIRNAITRAMDDMVFASLSIEMHTRLRPRDRA